MYSRYSSQKRRLSLLCYGENTHWRLFGMLFVFNDVNILCFAFYIRMGWFLASLLRQHYLLVLEGKDDVQEIEL